MATNVRVNRWLDLLDRVGWTFVQTSAGSIITLGFDDWQQCLSIAGIAALASVVKTGIGQNVGNDETGSLVPGSVVETKS